jgi:hypothetical protein
MKRALAIAAILFPLVAHADDFARTKAAEELVDLMNSISPFDQAFQNSSLGIVAPLVSTMPCPATALPDVQKSIVDIVNYRSLRPYLIKTYAETFDFNELAVIRAFYTSTTGKRLLQLSPQMEVAMQGHSLKLIQEKLPVLREVLNKHTKDAACAAPSTAEKKS